MFLVHILNKYFIMAKEKGNINLCYMFNKKKFTQITIGEKE